MADDTLPPADDDAWAVALAQQIDDGEQHDRGLIVERLSWTPEQRLAANASFLRFYLRQRPDGPLVREEDESTSR